MIHNPIIPGFNPDPSICFDGKFYYLTTSTFEYFPACPIYRSKNLSKWEFLRYAMDDDRMPDLSNCPESSGIYAATIRYYRGRYYIVTTNVNGYGNFLLSTDNIENGVWNGPLFIGKNGIDPSLYFEGDRCFFCSNGILDGKRGIIGALIDPSSGKLETELKMLTPGESHYATEAPHIYRKGSFYYLVFSEGGTEYGHHCLVARSQNIDGPYELYKGNPILSHTDRIRHPIQATGHADLIETDSGDWYAVFLAIRPFSDRTKLHNLGRETFLARVTWTNDGWPVIGDNGKVELCMEDKIDTAPVLAKKMEFIDFSRPLERQNLESIRNRRKENYLLDPEKRTVTLIGNGKLTEHLSSPTVLLHRQESFEQSMEIFLDANATTDGAIGGICIWHSMNYSLLLRISKENGTLVAETERHVHDLCVTSDRIAVAAKGQVKLSIAAEKEHYTIAFEKDLLISSASFANFSAEACMHKSFTGTFYGLFAEKGKVCFLQPQ